MARVRTTGRGGPRPGSGRPRGSGGPPEGVRRNRLTVLLTDGELAKLTALARERKLPVGTVAYQALARGLARLS